MVRYGAGRHPKSACPIDVRFATRSICIGIASFWLMKAGPSQTQSKVHPKGFFNDRDTKVIVNRVIRDDHTKATMHNREALTPKLFLAALGDYDLWPLYFVGLMFGESAESRDHPFMAFRPI